jgi:hypothetical protein
MFQLNSQLPLIKIKTLLILQKTFSGLLPPSKPQKDLKIKITVNKDKK